MRRRNYIPTPFLKSLHILLTFLSWVTLIYTILQIHPSSFIQYYYAPFFGLIFVTLFLTLLFFTHNLSIPILIPLGLITILILRLLGIKDWLNPLLMSALVITLIYFFTVKEDHATLPKATSIKQSPSSASDSDPCKSPNNT